MPDLMPMVHSERASLSDYLDTLAPEQWSAPTWCDRWNVQQLVAHLTAAGNITAPHFFGGFIKAGFNFDKTVDRDLRNYSAGSPADVKARYDAIINSNRKPPGPATPRCRRNRGGARETLRGIADNHGNRKAAIRA